jgi:hypothetical protein
MFWLATKYPLRGFFLPDKQDPRLLKEVGDLRVAIPTNQIGLLYNYFIEYKTISLSTQA